MADRRTRSLRINRTTPIILLDIVLFGCFGFIFSMFTKKSHDLLCEIEFVLRSISLLQDFKCSRSCTSISPGMVLVLVRRFRYITFFHSTLFKASRTNQNEMFGLFWCLRKIAKSGSTYTRVEQKVEFFSFKIRG